ncbi:hypothetical protein Mapa_004253 [Marchantia paleacea]|nr:hypothetical protein Mapa_004253 [Marchantia paleacea]
MYVYSSIWNGGSWATCGGGVKSNWTQQPFLALDTDFSVTDSCRVDEAGTTELHQCYTNLYWSWYGNDPYLTLTQTQIEDLRWIKNNYVIYDYCTDLKRFNRTTPPDCARNWP